MRFWRMRGAVRAWLRPVCLLAATVFFCAAALAQSADAAIGPVTKLPVPRFVSLKTDNVNVRQGPTKEHAVAWIFHRAGLPVEIIAEFEIWRRIRDSEGAEGWVYHSLLSGRRTALIS